MKNNIYILIAILFLLIPIRIYYLEYKSNVTRKKKQIGVYIIDLEKTNLGIYNNKKQLYEKLKVEFLTEGDFIFNMSVPFIYDSVGTWYTGGNRLEKWNYLNYTRSIVTGQFSQTINGSFYLNSTTPKKHNKPIYKIYFKKIKKT